MPCLVSILIPAYNAERWIAYTIKSALSQTWTNKEIILVDDGSSDNTLDIAKQFQSKLVRVISQENRGACAARNKALTLAQGEHIQWLDADDLIAPDKITQQLKKNDIGQNTRILLSSAWGTFYFRHQKAKFIPNSLWQDLTPLEWLVIRFIENIWMPNAAWLVSRRLTELAGPWDERLIRDNDGEYFCRVVSASEKVKFVPDSKFYYRVGNFGSVSTNLSNKTLDSLFLSISLCINHLRSLEDNEKTRDACVKYLQNRLSYFYPEKLEILEKANELAQGLGGNLLPPKESWKFILFRKIFGWKMAKNVKKTLWKAETFARKNWDRLPNILSII